MDAFEESGFKQGQFQYSSNYAFSHRLFDNYDRLEEGLNFVRSIEFSERADTLLQADAGRFLRIFNNFNQISSAIRIERPELFLRLLTNCDCLQYLSIQNSGLPQQWFEQLANIQTLSDLRIVEKRKIHLSFTFKLPVLRSLITNHYVDLKAEIRLDERRGLHVRVERREFDVTFRKERTGTLYEDISYREWSV